MLTPNIASRAALETPPPSVLVLGGQRSGKSRWAETWVLESGLAPTYIATAEIWDDEMRRRVEVHRARRGAEWTLVEAPLTLPEAIRDASHPGRVLLVDCLTLWLTNVLMAEHDVDEAASALLAALVDRRGPIALVSTEVGSGVVPMNALARRFVDEAGALHQRLAATVDEVVLVTAGLAQRLKDGDALGY